MTGRHGCCSSPRHEASPAAIDLRTGEEMLMQVLAAVSIAGLFQGGFVVAMVLLMTLLVLARWTARNEDMSGAKRASARMIGKFLLVAAPALALPFLIRTLVAVEVCGAVSRAEGALRRQLLQSPGGWRACRFASSDRGDAIKGAGGRGPCRIESSDERDRRLGSDRCCDRQEQLR